MHYLAERMSQVKPSPSIAVSQVAKKLLAQGIDVIDLGMGEPDFDTPRHVIEAANQAAKSGHTRYTATGGALATKAAVIEKFKRDNGLEFSMDEIVVSNGAKQVIFNALMATLESNNEVIMAAPYFVSYPDVTKLIGGVPVAIECQHSSGFKLTPQMLEDAITPNTKWLILNSPSNPSGAVYGDEELQSLGEVLASHPQVLILSDEIYEHVLFDNLTYSSFGAVCPQLRDRTLIVNGVSKAYAMTGWRIGFGAGPSELIHGMTVVQSQSTTNACSVAQVAAVAALTGSQEEVRQFRSKFEYRRNFVVDRINDIDGLILIPPAGAFYAYINCSAHIGKRTPNGIHLTDDDVFTKFLLDEARIAAVPGSAYGLSPYFRISTAASDVSLLAALDRIEAAIDRLEPNHT